MHMKNPLFTGTCTALVTPFENGKLNLSMLERLMARQREAGVTALVLAGTTGEAPTLSDEEKSTLFRHARAFDPTALLIAGTGSNDTRHACALSRMAEDTGMDALLVVTPYYNKATAQGLRLHYQAVAASVRIPVIAYNVPGRTGVELTPEVCAQLAAIPNLAGIKQAASDIRKTADILCHCPRSFPLWSGNDDQTVPMMSLGALGVISVLSNLLPEAVHTMTQAALAGDFDTASALQLELLPWCDALFREVNPIPVKAALSRMGLDCGAPRLPLTPASPETLRHLEKLLAQLPGNL